MRAILIALALCLSACGGDPAPTWTDDARDPCRGMKPWWGAYCDRFVASSPAVAHDQCFRSGHGPYGRCAGPYNAPDDPCGTWTATRTAPGGAVETLEHRFGACHP